MVIDLFVLSKLLDKLHISEIMIFLFLAEHSAYQSRHCPYLDTIDRYMELSSYLIRLNSLYSWINRTKDQLQISCSLEQIIWLVNKVIHFLILMELLFKSCGGFTPSQVHSMWFCTQILMQRSTEFATSFQLHSHSNIEKNSLFSLSSNMIPKLESMPKPCSWMLHTLERTIFWWA